MSASLVAGEAEPAWVAEVLESWFEQIGQDQWFKSTPITDTTIRVRFGSLLEALAANVNSIAKTSRPLLAGVIILDQFPRNIFRGTARAYATDSIALSLSRYAVSHRFDATMTQNERQFLYLPFQHSENRDDQALAVELIGALGNSEWTDYAISHRDVIDRFGRCPHRKSFLGRNSTPEEIALLKTPTDGFCNSQDFSILPGRTSWRRDSPHTGNWVVDRTCRSTKNDLIWRTPGRNSSCSACSFLKVSLSLVRINMK